MSRLQDVLARTIPEERARLSSLMASHHDAVVGQISVASLLSGMRGLRVLLCDTSQVDPDRGLRVRGIPIGELTHRLPEEIFYLLCTGSLPDAEGLADLQAELRARASVPDHVFAVIDAMPDDAHPMAMLSAALLSMQGDSVFARDYATGGLRKEDLWRPTLEDALNLLGRLPRVAAGIYRKRLGKGPRIEIEPGLSWARGFAAALGIPDPDGHFADLMRLYLVLHCDHEGGNVSAHACTLVGSALSDLYYAVSAGLNGLAGPLHGLANQECLRFLLGVQERYGGVPTEQELRKLVWEKLGEGQVIPGYGHAVLRCADPRFVAFHEYGRNMCADDELFRLVDLVYRVVPEVLTTHGKAKNPYPNVDAGSGALLHHFGMTEFSYYTVLFSVSRALGLCAQTILNRGILAPLERPKSVSTEWLQKTVAARS